MWRWGRVFIPIWIVAVAIFTCAAAADAIWRLGWGYRWQDALLGLGMVAFGLVFWVAWGWMFKLIRWLNETFYGPEVEHVSTVGNESKSGVGTVEDAANLH